MEKKLLITGFEPFGGQTVNPSWEAVRRLPEVISEFRLVKMEVPVLFGGAVSETIIEALEGAVKACSAGDSKGGLL